MIRLYIVVEGQTEETFIDELVKPLLNRVNVAPRACLIGKPGHKGGYVNRQRAEGDILRLLKQDLNAYCTTLFDYFRLDASFPGRSTIGPCDGTDQKAQKIETAFFNVVQTQIPDNLRPDRFLPYIQMHEFEGLLFSDPEKMAKGMYQPSLVNPFKIIRESFISPEDINDGSDTAPSKRILNLYAGYDKVRAGTLAALEIGLQTIRRECKRFDTWLSRLENLGGYPKS